MPLLGLDCANLGCFHKSVQGYRLKFELYRTGVCAACGLEGKRVDTPDGEQMTCPKHATWWTPDQWQAERSDMIFRTHEFLSMLAQLSACGVPGDRIEDLEKAIPEGKVGNAVITVEDPEVTYGGRSPAFPLRRIFLNRQQLPRTALYFRWNPEANEVLTPDKVFQCYFPAGATPSERHSAAEIPLSGEMFSVISRRGSAEGDEYYDQVSSLKCQHCQEPLPLKAFNTKALRVVDKGD